MILLLSVFDRNMQRIEKKDDKWLLHISSQQIFCMIKFQTKKFIETPQMIYIFIVSLFNFLSLIHSQINFPYSM
jgi:hypothetical protein